MPSLKTLSKLGDVVSTTLGKLGESVRAYHSSPHDFEKFDISKLGSGQGAASYGKGIYTAENPAVSGVGGEYWQEFTRKFTGAEREATDWLALHNFDRQAAATSARQQLNRNVDFSRSVRSTEELASLAAERAKFEKTVQLLESDKPVGPRTYEVDIKRPPRAFLDWDAPLGGQPAVKQMPELLEAASNEAHDRGLASTLSGRAGQLWDMARDPAQYATGEMAYQGLLARMRGMARPDAKEAVMLDMRSAGIPGIRYLDQGSRGVPQEIAEAKRAVANIERGGRTGTPEHEEWLRRVQEAEAQPLTRNYVVNQDSLIDILKKYGISAAVPAGGALTMRPDGRY